MFLTKSASSLLLACLLGLRHSRQVIEEECGHDVEDNIHPHEAPVAPSQIVVNGQGLEERVGVTHRAIVALAGARATVARQVAANCTNVSLHVVVAVGAVGRRKGDDFVAGTFDWGVGEGGAEEAFDDIGERIDLWRVSKVVQQQSVSQVHLLCT